MLDPWELIVQSGITVEYRPIRNAMACTDGTRAIWIDPRLTSAEERCALMHELVHIQSGHTGPVDNATEQAVRRRAARELIDYQTLADATAQAHTEHELAELLNVTPEVLADRYQTLTPAQKNRLAGIRANYY